MPFVHRIASFAVAAFCTMASPASAAPVSFGIDAAAFAPGSGYGIDTGSNAENGGTLLDVWFTSTFVPQSFSLDVGAWSSFSIGSVNFLETDSGAGANSGVRNGEADNLGVMASLSFIDPFDSIQQVTAVGLATLGVISDAGADFRIDWSPLIVNFGSGGAFEISLDDLSFTSQGLQTQSATITLLSAPQPIAEPGTLALFGIALTGLACVRRRRPA